MKHHVKVYLRSRGFKIGDFIPCENCGKEATDIDHIHPRGMGGSKLRDNPENLRALCRTCHTKKELHQ